MIIDDSVNSISASTIIEKIIDNSKISLVLTLLGFSLLDSQDISITCKEHDQSCKIFSFILAVVQATRYCRNCKVCICTDCALENHLEHIADAKIKLSEILGSNGKEEWKELHGKLDTSIKTSNYGKKMLENLSSSTNQIEIFVKDISNSVNSLKGKLDSFSDSVNEYKIAMITEIQNNQKSFIDNINYNGLEKGNFNLLLKSFR